MALAGAEVCAVDYTRVSGTAASGSWTDSTKWTAGSGFPGSVSDTATFNTGGTQQEVTLDSSQTIRLLGIGYSNVTGTSAVGNIKILSGGTAALTVGSTGTAGSIFVGAGNATPSVSTGTLALGSGVQLSLVGAGSAFYIAGQSANTGATGVASTGAVVMEAGSSLILGSGSARSQWYVGRQQSGGSTAANGSFSGQGGQLSAYLSTLIVGQNLRASSNTSAQTGIGSVNLSGLTSALVDTTNLYIGNANENSANGSLTLGDSSTLTVGAGAMEIGVNTNGNTARLTNTTVTGVLNLGSGSDVTIGSAGGRAAVVIGRNNSRNGANLVAEGTVSSGSGSAISAHLSSLTIGSQERTDAGPVSYRATGIMDFRQANVTAFDVSGNVTIGYHSGTAQGSQGELRLPEMYANIGGNLIVGDTETGGGSQASSSGLLDLVGTHVFVDGNARFNATGRAKIAVNGQSAGLRLDSDSTFTLTLAGSSATDENSAYYITFADAEATGLYYGFAWEGNHLAAVQALVDGYYITWANNMTGDYTPGVFYDALSDVTYVGVTVPEPSVTVLLLAGGAAICMFLRKRRMHSPA